MLPMPPTMTMAATLIDTNRLMLLGKIEPTRPAKIAPPRPANAAPRMYASSFVWIRFTPIASATSSSSRMATQARPMRPARSRKATNATSAAKMSAM